MSKTEPESSLWTRLAAMPRPFRLVDFPRKGEDGEPVARIHMWILSQEECLAAQVAAEKYVRRLFGEDEKGAPSFGGGMPKKDEASIFDTLHQNAVAVELLFRACRRVESPDGDAHQRPEWPFFPSPAEVRKKLTNDEIGVLMREYLQVQADLGPIVSAMTAEEVDGWVERIAKSGTTSPFASLSWDAASELILHMASRLWSFRTATSSSGSPPADGSRNSDDDQLDLVVREALARASEEDALRAQVAEMAERLAKLEGDGVVRSVSGAAVGERAPET